MIKLSHESIDQVAALRVLSLNGYTCQAKGDAVLVSDPEQSSVKGLVYRNITLYTDGDLLHFLFERS